MKEFNIVGKLRIEDDLTHKQLLDRFYIALKNAGIFFSGETKLIEEELTKQ